MAAVTLAVRAYADDAYGAVIGATMLMVTLSVFHIIAGLSVRGERETVFSRESLPAWAQLRLYGLALLLALLVTEIDLLQRVFGTTSLTLNQWLTCIAAGLSLLLLEEGVKFLLRQRDKKPVSA
jgi:Ca2+-transporting ATPase